MQMIRRVAVIAACMGLLATVSGTASGGRAPARGISLVNISQLTVNSASAFHRVAVSRVDPNLVAVAWRDYGFDTHTRAPRGR